MTTNPCLDLEQVASLRELGDDLFIDCVAMYADGTKEGLAKLRAAVNAGDLDGARREAHKLKGSSGTVGAASIAKLFEDMQHAEAIVKIRNLLDATDSVFEQTMVALESLTP